MVCFELLVAFGNGHREKKTSLYISCVNLLGRGAEASGVGTMSSPKRLLSMFVDQKKYHQPRREQRHERVIKTIMFPQINRKTDFGFTGLLFYQPHLPSGFDSKTFAERSEQQPHNNKKTTTTTTKKRAKWKNPPNKTELMNILQIFPQNTSKFHNQFSPSSEHFLNKNGHQYFNDMGSIFWQGGYETFDAGA